MSADIPRIGLGLLGGTFDPVHNGHLALASAALQAMHLARIELIPTGHPWQKTHVTASHHRLAMLHLAVENEPHLRVNTIELLREGQTYTIDTLREMRLHVGPSIPLVLIIGGDQWANLATWYNWPALFSYAHIAVCERAGEPLTTTDDVRLFTKNRSTAPHLLCTRAAGSLTFFEMAPHAASATVIRSRLLTNAPETALRSVENWLPISVAQYIKSHGLYIHA